MNGVRTLPSPHGLGRPRETPGHRRGREAKLTLVSRFLGPPTALAYVNVTYGTELRQALFDRCRDFAM
jgi:hypothetical protein